MCDRLGASGLKKETNMASETCCLRVLKYLVDCGHGPADDGCVCTYMTHAMV